MARRCGCPPPARIRATRPIPSGPDDERIAATDRPSLAQAGSSGNHGTFRIIAESQRPGTRAQLDPESSVTTDQERVAADATVACARPIDRAD